jgi:hypothetical protein
VLWLLFDETDQRLCFDQRPAKVELSEFDRLRAESLSATNAFPPGDSTIVSVPGLISGRAFSNVAVRDLADLNVTLADSGEVSVLSRQPSVFSLAKGLGINSAVVGWYHPYDRLFGASVSSCAWYPLPAYEPERAETLGETVVKQLDCLTGTLHIRRLQIELCRAMISETLKVVTNNNYGLIFLHLPPPHRPGIYLPDKDQYTVFGMPKLSGYFNNLILADRWLGMIRRTMESAGQWDRTWLILSSDHSWRESRLYDGRRDLRVPFIVKAPHASQPETYSEPLQTVLTHDLILAIFRGDIVNQSNLIPWLNGHRLEKHALPQESQGTY